ncbi:MAG: magnesium transporter CorA family protein [Bacteroidaceae bacterium]|jgi:magnesium transporter|nr:magnesium transporter CorA family protein [Bacteroidaceae bacterium]MBQ1633099.1 magnesium transporter CorA family protein [Bacteroidaceae bacterium]MBQ6086163.1 magnesium transporter CorA family protein [Bacteroidaceae bacterium]MBR4527640.1 magnesium transporter CorA family protein [Bacteroidaceae bacterium]MBR6047220.1 magnesium transporter CorA family protein [Bacteroidaceae bacterium]
MRTYWNTTNGLRTIDTWEPNCWVQVTCPTQEDVNFLENELKIPDYYISDIADTDERARYDIDEGWILIILRIPYVKETRSRTPYTTIPLGIIMKGDVLITVCNFETNMMIDFVTYQQKRGLGFTDSVDMVFRLFLSSAVWYLKRLKQISARIDKAKQNLDKNVNNADLINLSRLQDSLTYFVTSIRGNENLLSKLKFKLPVDELDADMIEDVNIEMSQARETTNIYSNILDSTMDTYANIINNNMSSVMKMLTSISIILMFPTLIASLFGMNLINGMEHVWWGFPFALFISIGITVVFMWYFKRKTWI